MTILLSFVMSANYVFCIFIQTKTIVPSPDRPWEGEIITFTLLGVNVVVLFLSAVVTVLLMRSVPLSWPDPPPWTCMHLDPLRASAVRICFAIRRTHPIRRGTWLGQQSHQTHVLPCVAC